MCTSTGSDTVSNSSIRLYFIAPFSSHFLFFSKTGSPLLPVLSTDPAYRSAPAPPLSLGSGLPWESRIDVTKGFRAGPEGQRWNQGQRHGFAPSMHERSCAAPPRPQFLFRHGFSAATSSLNTAKLLPGERERGKKKKNRTSDSQSQDITTQRRLIDSTSPTNGRALGPIRHRVYPTLSLLSGLRAQFAQ